MKIIKWIAGIIAIGSTITMADVFIDFSNLGTGAYNVGDIALAFTVDLSGSVVLDASCSSAETADIAAIDAWDGIVGTVTNSDLFDVSFTLMGVSDTGSLNVLASDGGVLGINGPTGNSLNGIDGEGLEILVWSMSGDNVGLGFKSFSFGNREDDAASNLQLVDHDTTNTYILSDAASFGSVDISADGFFVQTDEPLAFTTALTSGVLRAGAGLAGFSFTVEPASLSDITTRLNSAFADNMVLQRNKNIPIFGVGNPGEQVIVEFDTQEEVATVDIFGKWEVLLDSLAASTVPRTLSVYSSDRTLIATVDNVLIGDVWVCAGQSNMALMMSYYDGSYNGNTISNVPYTRYIAVTSDNPDSPQDDATISGDGTWRSLEGSDISPCSIVAYFFAERWQQNTGVPLGFIIAAEGGKIIEAFMSQESIDSLPPEIEIMATASFNTPGSRYNSMIHPLHGLAINGVLWYQAEANTWRNPLEYGIFFKAMIEDWRERWGQGDFPFLFIQLPSHDLADDTTGEMKAWIRNSQAQALDLTNTHMVVSLDVGEFTNVHPYNKQPIGQRISRIAEHLDGDTNMVYQYPTYDGAEIGSSNVVISFSGLEDAILTTQRVVMNMTEALPVGDDPTALIMEADQLHGFQICGSDEVFVDATAVISNNQVIVSNPGISNPAAVRYGWENFSLANFVGADDLPVAPFRTDDFDAPDFFGTAGVAPVWLQSSIELPDVSPQVYSGTLSNQVSDADGDTLTFSLVSYDSGPSDNWLSVASDGELSGTVPNVLGEYSWTVGASDGTTTVEATLTMTVVEVESIGINLQKTSATDVTGFAGVVSQANWNNGAGKIGSMAAGTIVDDSGATVSGMAVSWSFSVFPYDIKPDNQNQTLDGGDVNLLRSGESVTTTNYEDFSVTLTGITYDKYDLYVYIQGYQESVGRNGYARLNGIAESELGFNSIGWDFTAHNESTSVADADEGTYILWEDIDAATYGDVTINFKMDSNGILVSGVQLVEIPGPSLYSDWAAVYGMGSNAGQTDDYDNDGLPNGYEYGLGGNPTNGVVDGEIPTFGPAGGGLEYVHAQRSDDASLVYYLETTDDLVSPAWTNAGYTVVGTNVTGGDFDYVINSIPTTDTNTFIRLIIE